MMQSPLGTTVFPSASTSSTSAISRPKTTTAAALALYQLFAKTIATLYAPPVSLAAIQYRLSDNRSNPSKSVTHFAYDFISSPPPRCPPAILRVAPGYPATPSRTCPPPCHPPSSSPLHRTPPT